MSDCLRVQLKSFAGSQWLLYAILPLPSFRPTIMNDNDPHDDLDSKTKKAKSNYISDHPSTISSNHHNSTLPQLHPLQVEHQQQPWLIPHPSLPISWRNNDHMHKHRLSQSLEHSEHGLSTEQAAVTGQQQRQEQQQLSLLRFNGTQRPGPEDISYLDYLSDPGHESDPSELMRQPVLFGTTPPNDYLSSLDQQRSIYPTRPNRSMSFSMGSTNLWPEGPPFPRPGNGEVVPYTQEWRVIL